MISESERRIRILDYVRKNSLDGQGKITKSDVMRHMEEVSRAMTTHKNTIQLIKEGKIKMVKPKGKPYSQTDYLVINEKNEFNKIYYFLKDLVEIMEMMGKPFGKFNQIDPLKLNRDDLREMTDLLEGYTEPYVEGMEIIFKELLIITKNKIHSEKDKQILNDMLLKFQQKAITSGVIREKLTSSQRLGLMIARLGHIETDPFTRAKKLDTDLVNDCKVMATKFQTVLENFGKEFLN